MRDEDISRLTRKGYLQCPSWLFYFPADKFAESRAIWYGTLRGQRAILGASFRELREPFNYLAIKTLDSMVKFEKFIRRFKCQRRRK